MARSGIDETKNLFVTRSSAAWGDMVDRVDQGTWSNTARLWPKRSVDIAALAEGVQGRRASTSRTS